MHGCKGEAAAAAVAAGVRSTTAAAETGDGETVYLFF